MKGRNMDLRMDSASCLSHHGALISRGDLEGWAACDPDLGSSPFRLMNDLLQVMAFPFCVNSILNSIPPHLAIHEILNPETSERRHSHHVLTWVTEKPCLYHWCSMGGVRFCLARFHAFPSPKGSSEKPLNPACHEIALPTDGGLRQTWVRGA